PVFKPVGCFFAERELLGANRRVTVPQPSAWPYHCRITSSRVRQIRLRRKRPGGWQHPVGTGHRDGAVFGPQLAYSVPASTALMRAGFSARQHGRRLSGSTGPGKGGAGACAPAPLPRIGGFLLVAEPAAASAVVEEHEEHDQVDDRGGGQVDDQPLLPLAAVSSFCLSHCPLLRSYRIALPVLRTGD